MEVAFTKADRFWTERRKKQDMQLICSLCPHLWLFLSFFLSFSLSVSLSLFLSLMAELSSFLCENDTTVKKSETF